MRPFKRRYYCRAHPLVAEKYFNKYSKNIPETKSYSKTSNILRDLKQRIKLSWELCQQGRHTCTASNAFYTFCCYFFLFLHISCVNLLDLTNIYYLLKYADVKVDVFRFAQQCTHLSLH